MEEIWKQIQNYSDYEVSNLGRIKSISRLVPKKHGFRTTPEIILREHVSSDGYVRVGLYKGKKQKSFFIHRLVLEAFVGQRPRDHECNHKDGNKRNNIVTNLEWVLHYRNQKHAVENGLYLRGARVTGAKLSDKEVWLIKHLLAYGKITQGVIAVLFKVSDTTISDIKKGKIWTHIKM